MDHLNSVRTALDETGTVVNRSSYDAFGNVEAQTNPESLAAGPSTTVLLFTSREFDIETGLYYHRARYYDPSTGRWTTEDPLRFLAGDLNLYRYVFNVPVMSTDPSGQVVPILILGGVVATVGGVALMEWATWRYNYIMENYLSRPIHEWTPELQREIELYSRRTDVIALSGEIAGWTGMTMVAIGLFWNSKKVIKTGNKFWDYWLGGINFHPPHPGRGVHHHLEILLRVRGGTLKIHVPGNEKWIFLKFEPSN
ncbi:MAG: RHS repeat-associated core domain-containing protein [Gemmatales bacterium]|nr:RHS repeat-associated core domain-containing protein [Gemmatales bacterium]